MRAPRTFPRPGAQRGAWRHAAVPALALVVALAAWFASSRADTPPASAAAPDLVALAPTSAGAFGGGASGPRGGGPLSDKGLAEREGALQGARQRLARAEQTLAAYREAMRYPHDSRPAAEHADQMNPRIPVTQDMPLLEPGRAPVPGFHVRTTQERVFVSGSDTTMFTVTVVDDSGAPVDSRIVRSISWEPDASALARRPGAPAAPIVPLAFADDGSGSDAKAGDHTWTAVLAPSLVGFANFPGSIRTELTLQVGESQGYVNFDVVYAPNQPATWTGAHREALEAGSLNLYLGASIRQSGRYVVTGRVDDATGKPFALVSFNDDVKAGDHEIRLTVFGKLVRDQQPVFPLTLRDVDGFLLKPDTYPDRDLMPRLDGPVMVTHRYQPSVFSDAEWNGEEKQRYLTEYGKDVTQARQEVARLGGGGP